MLIYIKPVYIKFRTFVIITILFFSIIGLAIYLNPGSAITGDEYIFEIPADKTILEGYAVSVEIQTKEYHRDGHRLHAQDCIPGEN